MSVQNWECSDFLCVGLVRFEIYDALLGTRGWVFHDQAACRKSELFALDADWGNQNSFLRTAYLDGRARCDNLYVLNSRAQMDFSSLLALEI
ncbi:hypothetical protein CCR85_05285 [Rhodothalassium salexigens]|nr:hypothetical protein [Rhodothalassium salexigens]